MPHRGNLRRRAMLKAAGSAAGLTALSSAVLAPDRACKAAKAAGPALRFDNAGFYAGGKFVVEKGKDAVSALCRHHGYPVFPGFREKL